jgi:N-acetylglucosaminyl-diphospho-decaprenol L-rhamnosyltransferase
MTLEHQIVDSVALTSPPEISVDAVVVSYNSGEDLERQLSCPAFRAAFRRIIVVDNASRDDSVGIARSFGVEVIPRESNDSLSAAINGGVESADAEIVAILNPDVLFDDAALVARLALAFSDRSVAVNAPALRLPDGSTQDSARDVPTPVQLLLRRLIGVEHGVVRSAEPSDVDWIVSAFILVRRSAFEEIGGFEEDFRLYFEDVDFCVRLWKAGWRVRIDPRQVARHEHKASSRKSLMGWAMRQHVRSAVMFFFKHPEFLISINRGRWREQRTAVTRRPETTRAESGGT